MLILSNEDIAGILAMDDCMDVLEGAFDDVIAGKSQGRTREEDITMCRGHGPVSSSPRSAPRPTSWQKRKASATR